MSLIRNGVNTGASNIGPGNTGNVAAVKNIASFLTQVDDLKSRPENSERMGAFYGASGFGKTSATSYTNKVERCVVVEIKSYWTKKTFATAVLNGLGVAKPRGTFAELMEDILFRFSDDPGRILIIDEADYLVEKNMIELARDIHDVAKVPVILVGEEGLPKKLERWERIDGRVKLRVRALPADVEDARLLADLYLPHVEITEALLAHLVKTCKGSIRRIKSAIEDIGSQARRLGEGRFDVSNYRSVA